ncbi:MAG: hypothetical protein IPL01_21710 [Acidobacteria bacterium]|nr:hypothetical protein [Acidobacteriota bacterium]
MSVGLPIRRATDQFFGQLGVRRNSLLNRMILYFIKRMVERGLGVSLLPVWSVRDEVIEGKLSKLQISGHRLTRSVSLVSLGKFQSSPTRAFIEFILRHKTVFRKWRSGES